MRTANSKRRWLQFSLRTLLICLTTACVLLAVMYRYVEPWLDDSPIANAIERAGGSCETVPVGPDFLRAWFGPRTLQRVTVVDLSQPEGTAACLADLPRLRWLEKATLAGARFTDENLAAIGRLERLRELSLRGTTVTAGHIARLRAERPGLKISVEPLEITFADLRFEEAKGQSFSRAHLSSRILCLDGSPVRIEGHVFGGPRTLRDNQFLLAREDRWPRHGRASLPIDDEHLYATILIEMREGMEVGFSIPSSPVTIQGTLRVEYFHDPGTGDRAVYRMGDAEEVQDRP
jgi:hypothetical protein